MSVVLGRMGDSSDGEERGLEDILDWDDLKTALSPGGATLPGIWDKGRGTLAPQILTLPTGFISTAVLVA